MPFWGSHTNRDKALKYTLRTVILEGKDSCHRDVWRIGAPRVRLSRHKGSVCGVVPEPVIFFAKGAGCVIARERRKESEL